MRSLKIIGVDVFLERRAVRVHVGSLQRVGGDLSFVYDEVYFKARRSIPLGPEFPLTQRSFISKGLFPSLGDRIPSRQNPAFPEYCHTMGISAEESDPMVLLSTIGQRGPSSFVFYPIFERGLTDNDLIKYREYLGLTSREFAAVFEFSQSRLSAFERGHISGSEISKRLETIMNFPDVARELLRLNGGYLMHEKLRAAKNHLNTLSEKKMTLEE